MNKENSAPARLLPTDEENPNGPPGSVAGSPQTWEHQFFGEVSRVASMGPHDEAEEDLSCAAYIVDNTKGQYATIQSHIITPGAVASELVCKYSPTLSLGDMADFATLSMRYADAVVPRVSSPVVTPIDSRVKKLLLKLVRRGGNGVLTPEMWNAIVSATSGKPPTVPPGTGGPLPEDATWGNVLFYADAGADSMRAAYGDGDDVNDFHDQVSGNNLTTGATLLLPKYRLTGIGGGVPCVEWDGANVKLATTSNPTADYGSYTYYFVIEALDGGDLARFWDGGLGDTFMYGYYADGSHVYAANNSGGTGTVGAADDWGMPDRHIYRFVKDAGLAAHALFVNGVFKDEAFCAPQTNNGGPAHLMDYLDGLGLSGRVGCVVAYDKQHNTASQSGSFASGKTAPELVLQAIYGTP